MNANDIAEVVDIYHRYMPASIFAGVGKKFLTILYRALLADPLGIHFVAEEEGSIIAFISAGENVSRLYRNIFLRRAIPLGSAVLCAAVRRPKLLPELRDTFFYLKQAGSAEINAEMLWIGILPPHRNRRLGEHLIRLVLADLHHRGKNRVKVSILETNQPVYRLLQRVGFAVQSHFVSFNKNMLLLTRSLEPDAFMTNCLEEYQRL